MTAATDVTITSRERIDDAGMSFTAERAALVDALATVGLAVSKRPAVPLLGGVLLRTGDDHVVISATDYDTTVTVRVPGTATSKGAVVVDHGELTKMLSALVKGTPKRAADALPATVRTLGDGTFVFELAGYTMPITTYRIEDYPAIPQAAPTLAQVDRETLTRDMARVLVAVSTDTVVPALTGIHLEVMPGLVTMAATDRYRLAVAPVPAISGTRATVNASALVPGQVIASAVKRFTGVRIRIGLDDVLNPGLVSFTCGDVTVSVRTIEAVFPPYRQLLPMDATGTVQVERAAVLPATRRAAAALAAKRCDAAHVVVTINRESLSVAPALDERADAVIAPAHPATVDGIGEPTRFWFVAGYLADALDSFTGETVTLHTQSSVQRPVLFTDAADGRSDATAFRHLLMPVRAPR